VWFGESGQGDEWYSAVITSVDDGNGTVDVEYEDLQTEAGVEVGRLRCPLIPANDDVTEVGADTSALEVEVPAASDAVSRSDDAHFNGETAESTESKSQPQKVDDALYAVNTNGLSLGQVNEGTRTFGLSAEEVSPRRGSSLDQAVHNSSSGAPIASDETVPSQSKHLSPLNGARSMVSLSPVQPSDGLEWKWKGAVRVANIPVTSVSPLPQQQGAADSETLE
jgi:hypothetical protein